MIVFDSYDRYHDRHKAQTFKKRICNPTPAMYKSTMLTNYTKGLMQNMPHSSEVPNSKFPPSCRHFMFYPCWLSVGRVKPPSKARCQFFLFTLWLFCSLRLSCLQFHLRPLDSGLLFCSRL